ncbi:replication endonuclease, partial [Pseudoalteromonas tetraodonis]|uniref:replication endonuclease n=1 Tax=Pseudoalteromonas tetraodonis TaxID=43659 RepID=UPI0030016A8A
MSSLSNAQYAQVFPLKTAINLTANFDKFHSDISIHNSNNKPATGFYFDSKAFRNRVFKTHSNLSHMLSTGYFLAEKFNGLVEADKRLKHADTALKLGNPLFGYINLSCSDDEICEIAEQKARYCELKISKNGHTLSVFNILVKYLNSFDIQEPELVSPYCTHFAVDSLTGILNRFADPIFWRRKLRKIQAFTIEQLARDLRLVHKKASAYVSQPTIQNRRERKRKSAEIMSDLF